MPSNSIKDVYQSVGPTEGTDKHTLLEKEQEIWILVSTWRNNLCLYYGTSWCWLSNRTLSKFSASPSTYPYNLLKGYEQMI